MPAFSSFDRRRYETVSVREGYRLWSSSYEDTIKEDMDLWLLERITTVPDSRNAQGRSRELRGGLATGRRLGCGSVSAQSLGDQLSGQGL